MDGFFYGKSEQMDENWGQTYEYGNLLQFDDMPGLATEKYGRNKVILHSYVKNYWRVSGL